MRACVVLTMKTLPQIQLIGIAKSFPDGFKLRDLSLDIWSGEIIGLIGANGSGKTTAMKALCGLLRPDAGEIRVDGTQVQFRSSAHARSMGIKMLPQFLELYPSLSVVENIFIGQEIVRRWRFPRIMDWQRMACEARALLRNVHAQPIAIQASAGNLSGGQQKAIALARLLAGRSRVLVFDEPMASLGVSQKTRLLEIFAEEAARGCSIVLISHDLDDILSVCNRIVVVRRGRIVADLPRDEADSAVIAERMSEG